MAVLSTRSRQKLPRRDFALPGKGEGKKGAGAGSYPIPDKAHARAALQLGAKYAGPAKLATIKAKVRSKYPSIKVGGKKK